MFNRNQSNDSKLARSIQRDYRRDANDYRTTRDNEGNGSSLGTIVTISFMLGTVAMLVISLNILSSI